MEKNPNNAQHTARLVGEKSANLGVQPYYNNPLQQTENNPYSGLDSRTNLSMWNRFTDFLGFTNHAGQLDYQQSLASNQYESELALKQKDLEYNSPEAQARRMRDAGLNPDLLGVENYEGQMSGNAANQPSASSGIAAAVESANNSFNNILMSAFEGIKTYVGLKQGLLDIDEKQLNNDLLQDDIVEQIGGRILRDTPIPEDSKGDRIRPAWKVGTSFRSKKLSRAVNDWLANNYDSLRHLVKRYEERSTAAENRNIALAEEGNVFTHGKSDDEAVQSIAWVNRIALDLWQEETKFAKELAKYNIDDINDKRAQEIFKSNNKVQKIVNDFKYNCQQIVNGHLKEHMNDKGLLANIIQYEMLMGQVGATDLFGLGMKGVGALGGVALNALLKGKGTKAVPAPYNFDRNPWVLYD